MKLFTHNLLMCNKKNCTTNNYPLRIILEEKKVFTTEFDKELILKYLKRIDLPSLNEATKNVYLA